MKPVLIILLVVDVLVAASASLPAAEESGYRQALFSRLDANGDGLVDAAEVADEHQRLFSRLLRQADRDNDGRLNADELAAGLTPTTPPKPIATAEANNAAERTKPLRLLLLKLDTDRDAFLTPSEAPADLRDAYDQLAAACDNDKNGEIAFRELVQNNQQAVRAALRVARRERWNIDAELDKVEREQGEAAARFDRPPSPRAVLGNAQRLDALFTTLDYDSDGSLTTDELPEEARGPLDRLLRRADRDRDGRVTRREFRSAGEQLARVLPMIDRLRDSQPDGKTAASPATKREAEKAAPAAAVEKSAEDPMVANLLRRLDTDGDQAVSRDEARGPLARRFDRADANRDGRIDRQELSAAARIFRSRRD